MPIEKYSKTGEFHKTSGLDNQDVILIKNNSQFCFYTLADGVSSRKFSKEGAQIACDTAAELFMRSDRLLLNYEKQKAVYVLLDEILYNLKSLCSTNSADIKDYASTLMFVLVDKKSNIVYVLNLGDGMCFATLDETVYEISSADEQAEGCFVTTTENVNDYVFFEKYDAYKYDSFFMMSDGAWRTICDNGRIDELYKDIMVTQNTKKLKDIFEKEIIDDDCSFAFVDLSGLRAKGIL